MIQVMCDTCKHFLLWKKRGAKKKAVNKKQTGKKFLQGAQLVERGESEGKCQGFIDTHKVALLPYQNNCCCLGKRDSSAVSLLTFSSISTFSTE